MMSYHVWRLYMAITAHLWICFSSTLEYPQLRWLTVIGDDLIFTYAEAQWFSAPLAYWPYTSGTGSVLTSPTLILRTWLLAVKTSIFSSCQISGQFLNIFCDQQYPHCLSAMLKTQPIGELTAGVFPARWQSSAPPMKQIGLWLYLTSRTLFWLFYSF